MNDRIVDSITRPVRFAFLLGSEIAKREVLKLITFCCETLGGWHNVIVPTLAEQIENGWGKFIEAADPDFIVYYGRFQNTDTINKQLHSLSIQPHKSINSHSTSLSELKSSLCFPMDRIYDLCIASGIPNTGQKFDTVVRASRNSRKVSLYGYLKFGLVSRLFEQQYRGRLRFVSPFKVPDCQKLPFSSAELTGQYLEYAALDHFLCCYAEGLLGPHILVAGDNNSLWDCCLFWNWRALTPNEHYVGWISIDDLDTQPENIEFAFFKHDKLPSCSKLVTSATLDSINDRDDASFIKSKVIEQKLVFKNVLEYDSPLASVKYLNGKYSTSIPIDGNIVIGRSVPQPYLHSDFVLKHLIAEINIRSLVPELKRGLVLPRTASTWNALELNARDTSSFKKSNRITRSGFSFIISPYDSQQTTNYLKIKSDEDIFISIFKDRGIDIEPSSTSKHMQKAIELSGGLSDLADLYRQPIGRAILDSFLVPHCDVPRTSQRRELYRRSYTLAELISQTYEIYSKAGFAKHNKKWVSSQVNQYCAQWLKKKILLTGFELNCPECDFETWYSIDSVGEEYTCWRCQAINKLPLNMEIRYRLQESFYQAHKENMIVPILTLDWIKQRAEKSFLFILPIRLEKGNPKSQEIDVVTLRDGELIIGECKVPNHMPKNTYGKYSYLAEKIKADIIVFSTITRKDSCQGINCDECKKAETEDLYSDEIFSHGVATDKQNWGDREKLHDFRNQEHQRGKLVMSLCSFDLGLTT